MPGSIRITVLEALDLPVSAEHVSVRVQMGKREGKTSTLAKTGTSTPSWDADFAFPVLSLADQVVVTLLDDKGTALGLTKISTPSIVEKGFRDENVALKDAEGNDAIAKLHLRMSFVLSEEERKKIELMRSKSMAKREAEAAQQASASTAKPLSVDEKITAAPTSAVASLIPKPSTSTPSVEATPPAPPSVVPEVKKETPAVAQPSATPLSVDPAAAIVTTSPDSVATANGVKEVDEAVQEAASFLEPAGAASVPKEKVAPLSPPATVTVEAVGKKLESTSSISAAVSPSAAADALPNKVVEVTAKAAPVEASKPAELPAKAAGLEPSKPAGTPAKAETSKPAGTPAKAETSKPAGTAAKVEKSKPAGTPAQAEAALPSKPGEGAPKAAGAQPSKPVDVAPRQAAEPASAPGKGEDSGAKETAAPSKRPALSGTVSKRIQVFERTASNASEAASVHDLDEELLEQEKRDKEVKATHEKIAKEKTVTFADTKKGDDDGERRGAAEAKRKAEAEAKRRADAERRAAEAAAEAERKSIEALKREAERRWEEEERLEAQRREEEQKAWAAEEEARKEEAKKAAAAAAKAKKAEESRKEEERARRLEVEKRGAAVKENGVANGGAEEEEEEPNTGRWGNFVKQLVGGAAIAFAIISFWPKDMARPQRTKYHVVRPGETLSQIVPGQCANPDSRFFKLNPEICDRNLIYPGQRLKL